MNHWGDDRRYQAALHQQAQINEEAAAHGRAVAKEGGGFGFLLWLLLSFTPAGLALVPAAAKTRAARGLAYLEFAERVAGRTAKASGILIFVALRERHVEIVPDAGFAAKVGDGAWDTVVAAMTADLRQGRLTQAVVSGIGAAAKTAATVFPYEAGDRNELGDEVITLKP